MGHPDDDMTDCDSVPANEFWNDEAGDHTDEVDVLKSHIIEISNQWI